MDRINVIRPVQLDSDYQSTTSLKRRDPDGDQPRERDERRRPRDEGDSVTLGQPSDDGPPELPQLSGPGTPAPPPHWERARRF